MSEPDPPLSVARVVEFLLAALVILTLLGSWIYGLLARAWFGA